MYAHFEAHEELIETIERRLVPQLRPGTRAAAMIYLSTFWGKNQCLDQDVESGALIAAKPAWQEHKKAPEKKKLKAANDLLCLCMKWLKAAGTTGGFSCSSAGTSSGWIHCISRMSDNDELNNSLTQLDWLRMLKGGPISAAEKDDGSDDESKTDEETKMAVVKSEEVVEKIVEKVVEEAVVEKRPESPRKSPEEEKAIQEEIYKQLKESMAVEDPSTADRIIKPPHR